MKVVQILLLALCLCSSAQADYMLGRKHQVKSDALDFTIVELRIDSKFVGFISENAVPEKFSDSYYAYATCPTDKRSLELRAAYT